MGHDVYFFEPPKASRSLYVLLTQISAAKRKKKLDANLSLIEPAFSPSNKGDVSIKVINKILVRLTAGLLGSLKLDFIIVNNPNFFPILKSIKTPFAYDHIDDTHLFSNMDREATYSKIAALMDLSVFNIYIHPIAAARDPKGFFLPNGVDLNEYRPIKAEKLFDAVALSNIAEWFDLDSILDSTKRILLVGPMDLDSSGNLERYLKSEKTNILWTPEVPKQIANLWVNRAEVGLVPFNEDHPVVSYAMPLKIIEYFACNIPVVTFKNEGIEELFGEYVTFYSREFGPDLDTAIDIAKQTSSNLRALAKAYAWSKIARQLDEKIRSVF